MKDGQHRGLRRRLVLVLAVTIGVAVAVALFRRVPSPSTLEDQIPDEHALIAAGLSGVPAPGQPTRPLAVDRVVVDGAHTYIAYHYTVNPGRGFVPTPILTLFDDRGNLLSAAGDVHCERTGASWPLLSWLPWQPAAVIRCLDREDVALPATAHAAVLNLDAQLAPVILPSFPAPSHIETVRVPLDLSALVHDPRAGLPWP